MGQMFSAYCLRNGRIKIGLKTPDKALCVGRGPRRRLREVIGALARLSYNGNKPLVPGVPEAENDDEAFEAVVQFKNRVAASMKPNKECEA